MTKYVKSLHYHETNGERGEKRTMIGRRQLVNWVIGVNWLEKGQVKTALVKQLQGTVIVGVAICYATLISKRRTIKRIKIVYHQNHQLRYYLLKLS